MGFGKFTFLNKVLLFSSNSTAWSVEILQMLRSIEFPLRFIGFDGHKLAILVGIFQELFLAVVVLMSIRLKIRTVGDESS